MPLQGVAHTVDALLEGPYHRVTLEAPDIANRLRLGQFVTADLGNPIREPLLPARISANRIDFLLRNGHGAAALTPGDAVDLMGPLGKAITLPRPPARLLLVGDAAHLPALLPMAHRALEDGSPVALALHVATAAELYPPALLPAAMEVRVVYGEPPELARDLLVWADRVLIATDGAYYPALGETILDTRMMPAPDFAQALVMPTIVCGVGACRSCSVRTKKGTFQACTDGPFFNLLELVIS
jgi:dihydroorotate dehydrogenase electron transfer subunit